MQFLSEPQQKSCFTNIQERLQKILKTIVPDQSCLLSIQTELEEELSQSLCLKKNVHSTEIPNIRVIDTCIKYVSPRKESGTYCCLSIEPKGVRVARVTLCYTTAAKQPIESVFVPYQHKETPVTLTDANMTATIFIKTVVSAVGLLLKKTDIEGSVAEPVPIVLVSFYFLEKVLGRDQFLLFEEVCEKGAEKNDDPLAGIDLTYLCNVQFIAHKLPFKVVSAISHSAASLLAGAYECPRSQPKCLMSLFLGETIQFSYFQPNAEELGFIGSIIDVDLANFNGNQIDSATYCTKYGLPYAIPDFEIQPVEHQYHRNFEKMTSVAYLPELCRRLIIRVFQSEAPPNVWIPESLTQADCLAILNDTQEQKVVAKIIQRIWNWDLTPSQLSSIKKIVVAAYSRSASLVASCVCVIAKRTGRLQPALGGVTVVLSGSLGLSLSYQSLLRFYLNKLLNKDTSRLVIFYVCQHSPLKGGALFGFQKCTQ